MTQYEQMAKTIISIGYEIPGFSDSCHGYWSDQSLLDGDVIVFGPDQFYEGVSKASFDESSAFKLKENTRHWHRELSTALEYGKTVFLMFRKFQNASVHTGTTELKGSRVVNYYEEYDNYRFLPIKLPPIIAKGGSEVVFKGNPAFATFWKEFKSRLKFESYLDGKVENVLFVTKTGERPIGGIFNVGKGRLVLLPPVGYDTDKFTRKGKDKQTYWTREALRFGQRLVETLLAIDQILRSDSSKTPSPAWVLEPRYISAKEAQLIAGIDLVAEQAQKLIEKKILLLAQLEKEQQLKGLLFETGKPLEAAVTAALRVLGYGAEGYDDGELELDQVIVSPEGHRYIGECEGKDSAAVNIDKFRQLEENIQTDLRRDEVTGPAIGILFGNGFRLMPPEKRPEQFTAKCLASAKRGAILVRTMDLYSIVRYIEENRDQAYAKQCRDAISAGAGGIVEFPPVPAS